MGTRRLSSSNQFSTSVTVADSPAPGAVFRSSYGLALWSQPGDRVDFSVSVELVGGAVRELFSDTVEIGAEAQDWHWREVSLDLSEFAGERIALGLHTRTSTSRGYGVWGSPVITRLTVDEQLPNIVLIAVDTLRADRLPGYGAKDLNEPCLPCQSISRRFAYVHHARDRGIARGRCGSPHVGHSTIAAERSSH